MAAPLGYCPCQSIPTAPIPESLQQAINERDVNRTIRELQAHKQALAPWTLHQLACRVHERYLQTQDKRDSALVTTIDPSFFFRM
jgi:hypothetical protein